MNLPQLPPTTRLTMPRPLPELNLTPIPLPPGKRRAGPPAPLPKRLEAFIDRE